MISMTTLNNVFQNMISHWLYCPVGTVLGSNYGNPGTSLLQSAMSANIADAFIAKLKEDFPILNTLSDDAINIYVVKEGIDRNRFVLSVGNTEFEVPA